MSDVLKKRSQELAQRRLTQELRSVGVVKPEVLAKALQGQVDVDLEEGLDHFRVLTPNGTTRVNGRGEPMTVGEFAREFAEANPELTDSKGEASRDPSPRESARSRRARELEALRRVVYTKQNAPPAIKQANGWE